MVMSEKPSLRCWTREEYHRAAELGLFRPDERLELLEGEVIEKRSPESAPHAWTVSRAAEAFREAFGSGFHIREEKPIVLSDNSEPEPDIVVVRGTLRQTPHHPIPANAVLVMEVSDSTVAFDQGEKAASYARSGIADYWLLNLRLRRLEIRRDPGPVGTDTHGFRSLQIFTANEEISPFAAPHITIHADDLLPDL